MTYATDLGPLEGFKPPLGLFLESAKEFYESNMAFFEGVFEETTYDKKLYSIATLHTGLLK